DVQRLGNAIQAAMRSAQGRGSAQMGEFAPPTSSVNVERISARLRDIVHDRIQQRLHDRVVKAIRERLHDLMQERLASELRSGIMEAQLYRGFDFSRLEKRVA